MPLADATDLGDIDAPTRDLGDIDAPTRDLGDIDAPSTQDAQQGLQLALPASIPASAPSFGQRLAGYLPGGGGSPVPELGRALGTIGQGVVNQAAPLAPYLPGGGVQVAPQPPAPIQSVPGGDRRPLTPGDQRAMAAAPPAAPPLVANPFAAKAGAGGGGPSPAMNVPLANPADIAGIAQAQKGEQAEEQGAYDAKIAGDEATEKLTGGEAADAKIRDIEGGIKANRARLDDEAHYKAIREGYERQNAMLVDPNRYAKSLDTGHKIMQTLANIFGGYSAGIHGGPNQAVEDYNRRVQQDIDAQKDNIANGYHSLAGQESAYEAHLQATGSPQQAEALSLTAHQEMLKTALGKIMASTTKREDYNKANAAWYAAAQLQHETMIKYHKYFPAGAMGGAPAAAGAGPTAADVTSARALSMIGNLEKEGEVPGTSWLDRLRHTIATKTGLGGSIESPEATRFYDAKDALVAKKMELDGVKRIDEDRIADYGKRWQTTEQMDQLRREVHEGLADKQALPAKGSKGRGRAAEVEEEP